MTAPTGRRKVRHVEGQPCPDRDGPHWLTNHEDVTLCRGCGIPWADLDAELNAGLSTRRAGVIA